MPRLLGFFVFSCAFFFSAFASEVSYNVEIDAGSSGSRVYLLKSTPANHNSPNIEVIYNHKVKPGLSNFAKEPNKAAASIEELLAPVADTLLKEGVDLHSVAINVLATGGMRLLPIDAQNNIYNAITLDLQQHSDFKVGRIATISGQEEAKYLWLAINYLKQNNETSLDGVIDLGGASSQIAYTAKTADSIDITFNGKLYPLFAKSVLGFGSNEMRQAVDSESCYPINYPLADGRLGSGDYNACYTLTKAKAKQLLGGYTFPRLSRRKHFVAVSGFYFAADYLELKKNISIAGLKHRGKGFCQRDWASLVSRYPDIPEKYLSSACALLIDSAVVLELYGFKKNQRIAVANKINNDDVSWVIGALLDA